MTTEENITTGIVDADLETRVKSRLKYNPIKADRVGLSNKITGVYNTATELQPDYDYSKPVPKVETKPVGTAGNDDQKLVRPAEQGKSVGKLLLGGQSIKQANTGEKEGKEGAVKLNENTYSDLKLEKKLPDEPIEASLGQKPRLKYKPIKEGNPSVLSKVNKLSQSIVEEDGNGQSVNVSKKKDTFPTQVLVEDKVVEEPLKEGKESEKRDPTNSGSKSKTISVMSKKDSIKEEVEKKESFDFDALMRKYNSIYTKVGEVERDRDRGDGQGRMVRRLRASQRERGTRPGGVRVHVQPKQAKPLGQEASLLEQQYVGLVTIRRGRIAGIQGFEGGFVGKQESAAKRTG